jgi:hypothetical protein
MQKLFASLLLLASALLALPADAQTCSGPAAVCPGAQRNGLALIRGGVPAQVVTDSVVDAGVRRAVEDLRTDLRRVAGVATTGNDVAGAASHVIVGTIGKSPIIDRMIRERKLDVSAIADTWEGYVHAVVPNSVPGVSQSLVIAGADKRGTIFGVYDLSRSMGVSPWHWWADVPVPVQRNLWILPGARADMPKVKYRGIFINDEEPALGPWARETFGGINAQFYEKVGELILRQRGNYLWPAMWGKSYFEDDPKTAALLDEMGVVVGTSHHEPLMRAHVDWERAKGGKWDYNTNAPKLRHFWRKGMERTQGQEKLVTIGMRGDGDEPMTEGTAIELLETIVRDQRKIIADVTGKPASETPQVWALYKEVQDYYDKGMKVPDDVTLLFADDNWGNIRRLPEPGAKRPGGYGVYYHFDYVGGPRNYKWLNTNQIERTWEQMNLAWHHGVDRLWIVNVGDIKPMEFPISFFLDHAWDPDAIGIPELTAYPAKWAAQQFGPAHAAEIGELLTRYTLYNARRKPELITPETFSLETGEADRVVKDWNALVQRAEAVEKQLPANARDAYFQLVLHPIQASANLNELYVTVAKNRAAAKERRPETNWLADRAEALYARHQAIRRRYEAEIAGGKWKHMTSQAVFGYTNWQQPDLEKMPEVVRIAGAVAGGMAMTSLSSGPAALFGGNPNRPKLFMEHLGVVAAEAAHATHVPANGISWRTIPNLGRTHSGVTMFPVTAPAQQPGRGPVLEFPVHLLAGGEVEVQTILSPTLDYMGKGGHRFAISIDNEASQIVNVNGNITERQWEEAVAQNAWVKTTRHRIAAPGAHIVRIWMIDPGLVFQRIQLLRPGTKGGYLGPPESARR